MSRSKKLLNNSLLLLFGTVITKGLNFIMAPLFTRWLSQENYGMFDLLTTYATLLLPVLAVGIHHAIFRFLLDSKSKEDITEINTNAIFINVIGLVVYFVAISVLSIFVKSIAIYIIPLTILIITNTFQNYMGMFVRGLKKLKLYTIINIICTASILFFVYYFVKILHLGLEGIIFGYSMGYFISGLIGMIFTQSYKFLKISKISKVFIKKMLKYSIPMIPNSIAWWIVNVSDRIIVNVVLGPIYNAILAVAHKIPNLCTTFYDVFQTAWLENASEAIKDNDWNKYFNKVFNIMGQICMSISIIIVATNFFIYEILFTLEYLEGKYLVPLLAVATSFGALAQTIGSVFIAEYDSKKQAKTMLQAGVVNIVIHLLLINIIGIYASAISTVVAYVFLFLVRYKEVNKKYNIYINQKTIMLAVIFIITIIISYLNIKILNIIYLIVAILIILSINKEIFSTMIKKFLRRN